MSLPVVLTVEAEHDFLAAADWYQEQAGLGAEFTREVHKVLEQLQATPDLHRIVYRDIRQARVARFPYLVFYRAKAERVEVIAILHGRRSTAAWEGRL